MSVDNASGSCPTCSRPMPDSPADVWADAKVFLFELTTGGVPASLQATWGVERQTYTIKKALEVLELVFSPGMDSAKAREIVKRATEDIFKTFERQQNQPRQRVGRPWNVRPT